MILRDPVHGLVAFERPEERFVPSLLDTREVQRLRHVRSLGTTSLAFPGAEHTRFAHSVGAAHVMQCYLARIDSLGSELRANLSVSREDRQAALAAALLHDAGHGPLSHLFEEVLPGARPHEAWTSAIVLDPGTEVHAVLAGLDPAMPAVVEKLVHGRHKNEALARAVSGTFDVDRCDYLLRDSYMTGVRYGLYDLAWLLRSLRLVETPSGGVRIAVDGSKGLPAVEGFFLARIFMYQQVYFHKASRAAEAMIRMLFARAVSASKTDPRSAHFARIQPALASLIRGDQIDVHAYLKLDDRSVWNAVDVWRESDDPVLRDLSERLARRKLFKTASLDDADPERVRACVPKVEDIARARGFDPAYYVTLDVAEVDAYDESDVQGEALEVAYQHRASRPLGRASFVMSRLRGEKLTRTRLVFPEEIREPVEAVLRHEVFV